MYSVVHSLNDVFDMRCSDVKDFMVHDNCLFLIHLLLQGLTKLIRSNQNNILDEPYLEVESKYDLGIYIFFEVVIPL